MANRSINPDHQRTAKRTIHSHLHLEVSLGEIKTLIFPLHLTFFLVQLD